ncbi:MAG: LicD family protein [Bacilli bacterium]|nr:LicD family protein [Bacilli bacterium]
MERISLEEHKKIMVNMLEYIDKICKENNIRYSIYSGTLLGAIRHNGFIPWDDDIDIALLRPEYEKIIKVLKENSSDKYYLLNNDIEETYFYPFSKLIDNSTILIEETSNKIKNYGVYIDILAIDGLVKEKNNKKAIKNYKIRKKLQKRIFRYGFEPIDNNKLKRLIKKILSFFIRKIGIKKILNDYNEFCTKISPNESDYLITNWPIFKMKTEIMDYEDFKEYDRHKFENIEVSVFKNYHNILKKKYGNYMELPPIEARRMHSPIVYKKSDKNEK